MTTGLTPEGSSGHPVNPGLGGSAGSGVHGQGAPAPPAAPAGPANPADTEELLAAKEREREERLVRYQQQLADRENTRQGDSSNTRRGFNDDEGSNDDDERSEKGSDASDGEIAIRRSALADFMKIATPSDLAHIAAISKILNPDPIEAQPITRRMMTEDMEEDFSSTVMQKFPVSSQVWTLWEKKQYIVLSLFTTASMRRLFEQPNSLPMKTISIPGDGNKVHILNVTSFGAELDLDLSQWHEAWRNYLDFIKQIYSPALAARWSDHYNFLASTDDFKTSYPWILRFDIAERTAYTFRPMKFDLVAYSQRFTQMKVTVMMEGFKASTESTNTGGPIRNSNSNAHQKKPYGDESRTSKPFPSGGDPKSEGSVCLICAKSGHKAPSCKTTGNLPNGRPLYAKYHGGSIVVVASGRVICFTFNFKGVVPCTGRHLNEDAHICSFCGSSDHHALSRKCL